jgi:apolipoprotein N-acyltransferase
MNTLIKHRIAGSFIARAALAAIGGFTSSLAFPRENLWPLIFVAVFALTLSVYRLGALKSFFIGLIGGLAFYLSQIEWLSLYLGPVPWLALSVLEALIFAVGMATLSLVWRYLEQSLPTQSSFRTLALASAIAVIWTAREWVSISLPYGGFPWSRLSQSQSDSVLAKWVYWGGLGWLTFTVALVSAIFVVWFVKEKNWKVKSEIAAAIALVLCFVIPATTKIDTTQSSGSIVVGAVQGNANAGLFSNEVRGSILRNHLDASLLLDSKENGLVPEVVVWPENASDLSPFQSAAAKSAITKFVEQQINVPLIFGTITERGDSIYNSSILWQPGLGATDWYDKKRPVPFAEYVPDRDFWYQLAPDLIGLVSRGYSFGTRDGIFEVNNAQLGSLICFEIAIDDIGRDLVHQGAQVILSQTNNADFGRSDETYQQAAFAKLRAIETGRTVVNISTVGVSAIYEIDGSVLQDLPTFEAGAMVEKIQLRDHVTPGVFLGGYIDLGLNLAAAALVLLSLRFALKRKTKEHA